MIFREQVYQVTYSIPIGRVMGYGHIASVIGSPRAARQVGQVLRALDEARTDPDSPQVIPWWRVIRSDGSIALKGDPLRPQLQQALLISEKIDIHDYRVDMSIYGWLPEASHLENLIIKLNQS